MPRTLILEPTRELAAQVHENFEKYGKNHRLNVALLIGGVSFEDQNRILDRGADVLIATPGRMLDQFERGRILLTGVDILVIDEADRMLDMGFIPDIERICGLLPPRRQTLFFSATMPPEIQRLTSRFLRDPVKVEVARQNSTAETIDQKLVRVSSKPEEKRAMLRQIIRAEDHLKNAIIFCNRKRDVATLARSLQRHGFSAGGLHGDMDQKSRMETLDAFKTDKLQLLIASDVAARGLDIPAVSHVFNFDVPTHAEDYVHRIGRTGRAGRSGTAITLAAPSDGKYMDAITKLIQRDIPKMDAETPDLPASEASEERAPRSEARNRRGRSRRGGTEAAPAIVETAPVEAKPRRQERPEGESKPRREPRPQAEAKPPRHEARPEAEANPPRQDARPQAEAKLPRRETQPDRQDRRTRHRDNEPEDKSGSPFGSDGPIPAFLLRPTRVV